MMAAIC